MNREINLGPFYCRAVSSWDGNSKLVLCQLSCPYCMAFMLYSWQTHWPNTNKAKPVAGTLYHTCRLSAFCLLASLKRDDFFPSRLPQAGKWNYRLHKYLEDGGKQFQKLLKVRALLPLWFQAWETEVGAVTLLCLDIWTPSVRRLGDSLGLNPSVCITTGDPVVQTSRWKRTPGPCCFESLLTPARP